MVRKLFLLSLLGSVYFSEISQLAAMDPPVSDFSDEEQHLSHLPLNRESIEETLEEISGYLTTSIEYSQRKLAEIESIYQLYQRKKKTEARREFNKLMGDKAASQNDKEFLSDLQYIRTTTQNVIIYNATSFLRELNEQIDGKFRYPRNFIGAGLIFAAAEQEIKDHQEAKIRVNLSYNASSLEKYLLTMHEDEIVFYSYLKNLSYPFYEENSKKNPFLFKQILQRQVDTFKALRLSHAEAQKKEEQEKIKAQKLARAKEAQEQSKPQGRGRGKARKDKQQPRKKENIQVQELVSDISSPEVLAQTPIIEDSVKDLPSTPVEIKTESASVTESIVPITPVNTIDEQRLLPIMAIKLEDNHAPLETETQMDSHGAVPIVSPPPVIAKEEEPYVPLKEVPQIREDKHEVKLLPQNRETTIPLSIGLTYETTHIAPKYKELFKSMFTDNIPQNTIEWQSVLSMMQNMNGFNGKMYGSGGKRQFAVFLLEKQGEPTKFVTLQDYEAYLKDSKKVKLEYKIVRKVAHTESPHTRGGAKEGARYMYPTLVKLFASSLEKIGLTLQKLGW